MRSNEMQHAAGRAARIGRMLTRTGIIGLFACSILAHAQHPAFFSGECCLTYDSQNTPWYFLVLQNPPPSPVLFGWYNYLFFPNLYHNDLGFDYFSADPNDPTGYSANLYDCTSKSWFWTSRSSFPALYNFTLSKWLWYMPDPGNPTQHYTSNPRRFYDLANQNAVIQLGPTADSLAGSVPFTLTLHGAAGVDPNSASDVTGGEVQLVDPNSSPPNNLHCTMTWARSGTSGTLSLTANTVGCSLPNSPITIISSPMGPYSDPTAVAITISLNYAVGGTYTLQSCYPLTNCGSFTNMGSATVPQSYPLTTAVNPAGAGTITLTPAGGSYYSGTVVQVSAGPNSGYQFSGFTGDLSGTTNPQSLTMNGAKSVTASFTAAPPTQTITTSPPGLSLTVDSVACTSPCTYQWSQGSNHTVTMTAAQTSGGAQYLFSYWSDGQPLSRTIQAPGSATTFTANFAPRVPVYGGISPSALEVNLGPLPVDVYDGVARNYGTFPSCPGGDWVAQACMQYFLSRYVIQGVTGVRFQFAVTASPSTAFDGARNVRGTWITNLSNFFSDLAAFGITKITATPSWDDFHNSLSGPTCAPYPNASGCPTGCKDLYFSPLLPYGWVPESGSYNPDGKGDNQAYSCSPANQGFWGWDKHYALVSQVAQAASSKGLVIEEFELDSEVSLNNFPVQARLIYDNTASPMTAVFQTLGQALGSGALTVSADTDFPGNTTPSTQAPYYPCQSVYGDAAQLLGSVELLAATGGGAIGQPPWIAYNGAMACDDSLNHGCGSDPRGWAVCATDGMMYVPSTQATPAVTDMHAKPCLTPGGPCNTSADATIAAGDTFSAVWDFLSNRGLTGNTVIFGETWSNSQYFCNGYPDQAPSLQTVNGYTGSCLYSYRNQGGYSFSPTQPCHPRSDSANVVFRP